MKVVVLGTGMVGSMIVAELVQSPNVSQVMAVDSRPEVVDTCIGRANNPKASGMVADLGQLERVTGLLEGFDVAVAALPNSLSMLVNRAAVRAGCHLIDLAGIEYPEKKAELDEAARAADVMVLTGCGVAPGIAGVLAARGVELLDEAHEAALYVGGLPRHPKPPLWYQLVFSLEGVMDLYTCPAVALEDGQVVEYPALSDLEECDFPEPVGRCEAVLSDAHSLAYTLKGKVNRVIEKTVRYRGHFSKVSVLRELGFLDEDPVDVEGQGVRPRRLAMALLEPLFRGGSKEDITVMRVWASGMKDGKPARYQWEMVDLYDAERDYTSMAKTTGFPPVIVIEWLAQGRLPERGFLAPEEVLIGDRFEPFIEELRARGVEIR